MLNAGVNLYAMSIIIEALLGWPQWLAIVVAAGFVLAYITLGGLSGAIYNEVLQFFVIIAGPDPAGDHRTEGRRWLGAGSRRRSVAVPGRSEGMFSTWAGTAVGQLVQPAR